MKKPMSFIVLFVVLLLSVSAHTERVYEAAEGFKAPQFELVNGDSVISLAAKRGTFVLLNFWSSADAQSRIANRHYDGLINRNSSEVEERICLLSVNFDRSERLFREIMRRDDLNAKTQFYVSGDEADMLNGVYHLRHGYRSYLIDPEGRIVAVNPSVETVRKIVEG